MGRLAPERQRCRRPIRPGSRSSTRSRSALVDDRTRIEELLRTRALVLVAGVAPVAHAGGGDARGGRDRARRAAARRDRLCSTRASARSTGSSRRSAACSRSPATPSATESTATCSSCAAGDVAHWQDAVSRERPPADRQRRRRPRGARRRRCDRPRARRARRQRAATRQGRHPCRRAGRRRVRCAVDVADEGPAPQRPGSVRRAGSDSSHGIGLRLARTLAESSKGRLELLATRTRRSG